MRPSPLLSRATQASEPGRNDPCSCGSGRKYKHCCAGKPQGGAAPSRPPAEPPRRELDQVRALRDGGRFVEAVRLAQDYVARHRTDAAGHSELGRVHLYAGRAAEATPCLLQAIRLAPKNAQYHYDLSFALNTLGRDSEAITGLRTALGLAPDHIEALERLGTLLHIYGRPEEALDCYRRVARLVPDTIQGRLSRAKILLEEGKWDEAERHLRESIALHSADAEMKRTLATLLREQGRFDEAIPLLEQATEGSPTQAATAYFDLSMSKRITEDDRPMLAQMQALLDYRPLQDPARQRVYFGLGKACDDLGEYAAAMRHFDAANRLAARGRPFDRAQFAAGVQRVMASTNAEFFAAHRGMGSHSELPVLILGMPRSGTTLVEQIASSHPEVGGGDELTFWNRAAQEFGHLGEAGTTPEHLGRVAADYEAVLRKISPDARRVTDKMPGNFLLIGLFHLVFPKGRIIHCRRHPVDTCLSNYFTNFAAPIAYTYDKGHLAFYYKTYRRLMAHWREVLPPGVMLELDYEELVADRERVTRQMITFLGLAWSDACLRPEDNQRIVRTASAWQARQPTYRGSVERWRRYEPWLGELQQLLEEPGGPEPVQPVSDNAKIPLARRLREAGRLDEAVSALQEALCTAPHDPVLYNDLGTLCLQTNRADSAADCFERAIGLSPNFAAAHYNLGAAQERLGRGSQAIAALRRAIALAPDLGPAHSRLGNLLQAAGERDAAMECFRRAGELMTSPADRDLEEAKLLLAEGRPAEAEPCLRRVVALDPANSLAHAMLGDMLGQAGQFDEAVALLRRATELDPDRIGAYHNIAILTKIRDGDRAFVARMEEMLGQPGRTEFDRTLLHFALGKAFDDLGDPARAIGHFDVANALEHRKLPFDRDTFASQVDGLIETFTPAFFARHAAAGTASELPLLVLGMPRSGTTLVEQILSAHPAIAAGGELTFWADVAADPASTPARAPEYLALLRRIAPAAERVTDKTPFNFLAIGLIHLALPQARIIHCRRSPLDTCLSIYFTRFAAPQPFAYDRGDLAFYYRQYTKLMAHWRRVLPADRLLEIDYEALTADREPLARSMVAFCGLDWDDACLAPERNQGVIRTASVWQARQPVYRSSVARWRRYEQWLGELRDLEPADAGHG